MNILPKKSWHPRTKKNIERIRRDEAEAEQVAKVEQDRVLRAEHEARIRELRIRSGVPEPEKLGSINLFEDHQTSKNAEQEREKKREEERWQERVGIVKRLVRTEDVNQPWYCADQPNGKQSNSDSAETSDPSKSKQRLRSDLITRIYDPMTTIQHAEQICRAKRLEQKREQQAGIEAAKRLSLQSYEFYRQIRPPICYHQAPKPGAIHPVHTIELSDSSPEIIGERKAVKVVCSARSERKERRKKSSKSHKHHRDRHKRHKGES